MTPSKDTRLRLKRYLQRSLTRSIRIRFFRLIFRFSTNSPYISGDSIAKCCDYYAFGRFENRKISIKKLTRANSIFVPGHLLIGFLNQYSRHIKARTIVSGNSDWNFLESPIFPKTVTLFLCQNLAFAEIRRAHTLPIGLENLRLGRSGRPKYHKLKRQNQIVDRILVPPMSPTNPVRATVLEEVKLFPELFDSPLEYLNEKDYFALTKKYKFILALEGNGYDNHRVWETLYQGSIPVMFNTPWSHSLKEYGLPILFVDSISEISSDVLLDFCHRHGDFIPEELEVLWTPFWEAAIKDGQIPKNIGRSNRHLR